ncbi:kinase-like protein [Lentinus tigrinus ALCF2SS1-6]|uniref:Kinase-like protein n=1 Tax=Lentinus tigrinus ALCF2SS1-6 TaxID=1328759 RepID=A0A5C2SMY9_9APHY|nr:kinase-like protein [Lentinus tigrinus ALCF2SS1-6]
MAPAFLHRLLSSLVSLLPIRLRAKMWKRLHKLGTRRWERQSFAQRCPGGIYIKTSKLLRLSEGQALQFIRTHTPLPVPVVIDNIEHAGSVWLVTSLLPGFSLAEVYRDITPEIERKLSSQLSRILAPLRALPPPDPVCGFDGGPVYCARIRFGAPPAGPWDTVEAFHGDLMHRAGEINVPGEPYCAKTTEEVYDVIRRAHARTHRVCLTHNDLGPHNILVDDHWNITGIVDWESCAWMPEYWEVTKGTFLPQYRKNRWPRIMSAAFPMYTLEQEAEMYMIEYRQCYV